VTIVNFDYSPTPVVVDVGTNVTWTNTSNRYSVKPSAETSTGPRPVVVTWTAPRWVRAPTMPARLPRPER
jgi:plastocyanin